MYCINDKAARIFQHLLTLMTDGYLKLDNTQGTFMPLIVEKIMGRNGFEAVYSVSHYGKQNGDLMSDPDMTFGMKEGKFYPLSFRNDYAGVDQEVISYNGAVDLRQQKELAEFAEMWFNNIVDQQELKL
jgi:hypothetical protein